MPNTLVCVFACVYLAAALRVPQMPRGLTANLPGIKARAQQAASDYFDADASTTCYVYDCTAALGDKCGFKEGFDTFNLCSESDLSCTDLQVLYDGSGASATASMMGTCIASPQAGDECNESTGLTCADMLSCNGGRCYEDAAKKGEACDDVYTSCMSGNCVNGKCQDPDYLAGGAQCTASNKRSIRDVASYDYFGDAYSDENASDESGEVPSGSYPSGEAPSGSYPSGEYPSSGEAEPIPCTPGYTCVGGTCKKYQEYGAKPCDADLCPGFCSTATTPVCSAYFNTAAGGACSSVFDCKPGLACHSRVCTSPPAAVTDTTCTDVSDCAAGYTCDCYENTGELHCVPDPSVYAALSSEFVNYFECLSMKKPSQCEKVYDKLVAVTLGNPCAASPASRVAAFSAAALLVLAAVVLL